MACSVLRTAMRSSAENSTLNPPNSSTTARETLTSLSMKLTRKTNSTSRKPASATFVSSCTRFFRRNESFSPSEWYTRKWNGTVKIMSRR